MSKHKEYFAAKPNVQRETDAEIAFGEFLEQQGVDCDAFRKQWRISQGQFNIISHYLYGLTDDLSRLPPALAALLIASRQPQQAA
jgi:hypothetical protein